MKAVESFETSGSGRTYLQAQRHISVSRTVSAKQRAIHQTDSQWQASANRIVQLFKHQSQIPPAALEPTTIRFCDVLLYQLVKTASGAVRDMHRLCQSVLYFHHVVRLYDAHVHVMSFASATVRGRPRAASNKIHRCCAASSTGRSVRTQTGQKLWEAGTELH
jgi:hypothetical protein